MNKVNVTKVRVTVVIVSYQSAQLTIDCLRSIQADRHADDIYVQAVVVDNASGDAPAIELAVASNAWSNWVTIITAPKNGGFAYGNNLAMQYAFTHNLVAHGSLDDSWVDYIHVLNPDTQIRDGAIIELVKFMQLNPKVGIAGSSFENADGSLWPIAFRFPSLLSELEAGINIGLISRLLKHWVVAVPMTQVPQAIDWIAGASMMLRRHVVEQLRGFDESYFLYYEETDLCLRAKRAGHATWYVPASRVMHIAGQSTKVTERDAKAKRLPAYWFESRRRYFVTNHGVFHAVLVDIVAIIANAFGKLKRLLMGKYQQDTPNLLGDMLKHGAFLPANMRAKAFFSALPPIQ